MRYLSTEEILILHSYQIKKFGGSNLIRDIKLLESAIARPQAAFSGKDLYEDIYTKASVLAFGVIQNHPFIDGNKRTGIHAMLAFLKLNGLKINFTIAQLVKLGNSIAEKSVDLSSVISLLKRVCR